MLDSCMEKAIAASLALTYNIVQVFKQAVSNLLSSCSLDIVYVDAKQTLQIVLRVFLRCDLPFTRLLLFLIVLLSSLKRIIPTRAILPMDTLKFRLAVQLAARQPPNQYLMQLLTPCSRSIL